MELTIDCENLSLSAPNCFVGLPPSIAATLLQDEGISLLVMCLKRRRQVSAGLQSIYVAWDGGASAGENALQVHPAFARTLSFAHGEEVSAEAVLVFDAPMGTVVCIEAKSVADYAAVIATAGFLETTLLNQIRVLCESLCFPIRLPGRGVVELKVSRIALPVTVPHHDYIVLNNGVEITVLAPPGSIPSCSTPVLAMTPLTLRAIPFCREQCLESRLKLLIQQDDFDRWSGGRNVHEFHVFVKRTPPDNSIDAILPVSLSIATAGDLNAGHCRVPDHVWDELGLVPYASITMEKIPDEKIQVAPSSLRFSRLFVDARNSSNPCGLSNSYTEQDLTKIVATMSVCYPGMRIENWVLLSTSAENDNNLLVALQERINFLQLHMEPWDKHFDGHSSSQGASSAKHDRVDEERSDESRSDEIIREPVVWLITGKEILNLRETLLVRSNLARNVDSFRLTRRCATPREFCMGELRGVSARATFKNVVNVVASPRSCRLSFPVLVLLRGAHGSGKTAVTRMVARYLRCYLSSRTIWIRWRVHRKEPLSMSLKRINKAFAVAEKSRPALIVFDDLDTVAACPPGSDSGLNDKEDTNISEATVTAHEISCAIVRGLCKCSSEGVRMIATSNTDSVLDEELRVPGVIANVLDLGGPSEADRASILASMLHRCTRIDIGSLDPRDDLRRGICDTARITEGYMPHDLMRVVDRVTTLTNPTKLTCSMLTEAVGNVKPCSQLGLRYDTPARSLLNSWDRVGGLWSAKLDLRETLELPSRHASLFSNAPIRMQSGILLYGPPGCGKTMLANVAALACGLKSISIEGPEVLSKYIGESEAEVRRLFQRASVLAPCVIIFDEFDALAPRRGGEATGVADRVVNTLLTALDGVERLRKGVFVIATSSRPELIDPALLRPGRIDRWIAVDFPDFEERVDVLRCLCHTSSTLAQQQDIGVLKQIADCTVGFSCADLRGIVVEAQIATREAKDETDLVDAHELFLRNLAVVARNAHPSLSARERARYQYVMRKFSRTDGNDNDELDLGRTVILPGKAPVHVALQ